jgi:acetylornithine deacetylase/succinyl-diaminopimelate desuccinylase-like protein
MSPERWYSHIRSFGLDEDPEDVRAHGKDERVGVESFYRATEFWYRLARLAGGW